MDSVGPEWTLWTMVSKGFLLLGNGPFFELSRANFSFSTVLSLSPWLKASH